MEVWVSALKSGAKTALVVAISVGLITFVDAVVANIPDGVYTPLLVAVAGIIKSAIKKWEISESAKK